MVVLHYLLHLHKLAVGKTTFTDKILLQGYISKLSPEQNIAYDLHRKLTKVCRYLQKLVKHLPF